MAIEEDAKKNGVNYVGLMDTLQWNTLPKDYTHGKTCPHFYTDVSESDSVQKVTFLEKYIMENVNRSIKVEEGSQFHFSSFHEDGVKGERPTFLLALSLHSWTNRKVRVATW